MAGLFRTGPRTSKPLQESEFVDVVYDSKAGTIRMSDDRDVEVQALRHANDGRRGSVEVDETKHFQDTYVLSNLSIKRVARNLSQRPSVQEMQARGLLYDHPSVSRDLIERQHRVQRRRASQKIDSFLKRRPSREVLESKNIIYRKNETRETRRQHKRQTSKRLEHYFKNERRDSTMIVANVNGVFVPYAKSMLDSNGNIAASMGSMSVGNYGMNVISSNSAAANQVPAERISDLEEEINDLKEQLREKNEAITHLRQNDKVLCFYSCVCGVNFLQVKVVFM